MNPWGRSMRLSYAVNKVIARNDDATWDARVELLHGLSPALFSEALHADFTPWLLLRLARHVARRPRVLAKAVARLGAGAFGRED